MNDRELLELAAKAAGYTLYPEWDCAVTGIFLGKGCEGDLQRVWDPLNDDGDALRLAVKLHMTVDTFVGGCEVGYDDMKGGQGYLSQDDGPSGDMDDFEVVRRAIVRAAAEMGRVE